MDKSNVVKLTSRDTIIDPLTELLRTGAEQLIYQAVEAEFLELLAEHSERRTEDGKAGVVRNGHLPVRELQMGLGPVTVQILKIRAKTGENGDLSLCPGTTICEENKITGSRTALAVSEGHLQWRDGRSPEGFGGPGCGRYVS